MAETEFLEKMENMFDSFRKENQSKKSFLSLESIIKLGFGLVMCALAYAGMSYKIDTTSANVLEIKQNQVKKADLDDMKMSTMNLQIQTCQTEIAVIKKQLDDMSSEKK